VIKNWMIANEHSEVAYPWRTQGVEIGWQVEDAKCRKHERANRMPAVTCNRQAVTCRRQRTNCRLQCMSYNKLMMRLSMLCHRVRATVYNV
jgi:hypothetical protein